MVLLVGLELKKILCKKLFPWSCLVLFCITIFSTQQENSRAVLNLVISGIKIQNFKIGRSCFIFGTETGREVASHDWAGIRWDRKWLVLNVRDKKFPAFPGKNIRLGMQIGHRGLVVIAVDYGARDPQFKSRRGRWLLFAGKQFVSFIQFSYLQSDEKRHTRMNWREEAGARRMMPRKFDTPS